jgi:hypothetical protein
VNAWICDSARPRVLQEDPFSTDRLAVDFGELEIMISSRLDAL